MIPFCDWLSTSHPQDELPRLVPAVREVADSAGFSDCTAGSDPSLTLLRSISGGLLRLCRMRDVAVVSVSGAALGTLRDFGVYSDLLSVLGARPLRVTKLHATMDRPVDAAPIVADVYARGHAGCIRLSRKAARPGDVTCHLSRRDDGLDSGTVYIGGPRDQVRAVVYDKRLERISKGAPDPGPLTRYEMRLSSRVGLSLRDAWNPAPLFFHVASPDILPAPQGLSWSPYVDGGFSLPPRQHFTPAELMDRKLSQSPDVQRLLELADACGPGGLDLLLRRLRRLAEQPRISGAPLAPEGPIGTEASVRLQ